MSPPTYPAFTAGRNARADLQGAARCRLLAALTAGGSQFAPQPAARSAIGYDACAVDGESNGHAHGRAHFHAHHQTPAQAGFACRPASREPSDLPVEPSVAEPTVA